MSRLYDLRQWLLILIGSEQTITPSLRFGQLNSTSFRGSKHQGFAFWQESESNRPSAALYRFSPGAWGERVMQESV